VCEIELKGSGHNHTDVKVLLPALLQQHRTVLILCPGMLWKEGCNCFWFNHYDCLYLSPDLWSSSLLCTVLHNSVHARVFRCISEREGGCENSGEVRFFFLFICVMMNVIHFGIKQF